MEWLVCVNVSPVPMSARRASMTAGNKVRARDSALAAEDGRIDGVGRQMGGSDFGCVTQLRLLHLWLDARSTMHALCQSS